MIGAGEACQTRRQRKEREREGQSGAGDTFACVTIRKECERLGASTATDACSIRQRRQLFSLGRLFAEEP